MPAADKQDFAPTAERPPLRKEDHDDEEIDDEEDEDDLEIDEEEEEDDDDLADGVDEVVPTTTALPITVAQPRHGRVDEEDDLPSSSSSSSAADDDNNIIIEETPPPPTTANPNPNPNPIPNSNSSTVTVALPPPFNGSPAVSSVVATPALHHPLDTPSPKRQRTSDDPKPTPAPSDDSRRLFQRLWTDEDEIELLQGFFDYTSQRALSNPSSHHHHHDTTPFYDQIKTKLQLNFNKNQLVEKLRRLKKKYRNAINRISSGKDFAFKSPHDQATFEISSKIWSTAASAETFDDNDDGNPLNNGNPNFPDRRGPRSRRRSWKRSASAAVLDGLPGSDPTHAAGVPLPPQPPVVPPLSSSSSVPSAIEDTVRSCLSPLFKELLYCAVSGPCGSGLMGGGMALNPLPLSFGGTSAGLGGSLEGVDERWRKQQILELEVYSKRLELVQEQIKLALEDLKSKGG